MRRLLIWCAALLLVAACGTRGGRTVTAGGQDAGKGDGKDEGRRTVIVEDAFIDVPDSLLFGRWTGVSDGDTLMVALEPDGSAYSRGLEHTYLTWRQAMANVVVMTRPGSYGGTITDTADIDVTARPMTMTIRGTQSVCLTHRYE